MNQICGHTLSGHQAIHSIEKLAWTSFRIWFQRHFSFCGISLVNKHVVSLYVLRITTPKEPSRACHHVHCYRVHIHLKNEMLLLKFIVSSSIYFHWIELVPLPLPLPPLFLWLATITVWLFLLVEMRFACGIVQSLMFFFLHFHDSISACFFLYAIKIGWTMDAYVIAFVP